MGVAEGAETSVVSSASDVTGRVVVAWAGKNAAPKGGGRNIDGGRSRVQRVCWLFFFTVSEKQLEVIDLLLAALNWSVIEE